MPTSTTPPLVAALACAAVVAVPPPAEAAVLDLDDVQLTQNLDAPQVVAVEVRLDDVDTSGGAIEAFSFDVDVSLDGEGVATFSDAGDTVDAPQLFADEPFFGLVEPDRVQLGKVPLAVVSESVVNGLGLVRLEVTLPAGVAGTFAVVADLDNTTVNTAADASTQLPITGQRGGTITVAAIPEPATLALLGLPALMLRRRA